MKHGGEAVGRMMGKWKCSELKWDEDVVGKVAKFGMRWDEAWLRLG